MSLLARAHQNTMALLSQSLGAGRAPERSDPHHCNGLHCAECADDREDMPEWLRANTAASSLSVGRSRLRDLTQAQVQHEVNR